LETGGNAGQCQSISTEAQVELQEGGVGQARRARKRLVLDSTDCADIIDCMPSITIRKLEPELKRQLRVRAARHGRSMEEEVRVTLREAISREAEPPTDIATAIRALFRPFGGVELRIPLRDPMRQPPKFR
jgi:plasmid stability protein